MRLYAEDPARRDLPQAGRLLLYREPVLPGVRVDSGVFEGTEISVHYDPLIAKLVASAETREAARMRAIAALRSYPVLGVRTNLELLIGLLEHPRFVRGEIDTRFVESERDAILSAQNAEPPDDVLALARHTSAVNPLQESAITADPWATLRGWRG